MQINDLNFWQIKVAEWINDFNRKDIKPKKSKKYIEAELSGVLPERYLLNGSTLNQCHDPVAILESFGFGRSEKYEEDIKKSTVVQIYPIGAHKNERSELQRVFIEDSQQLWGKISSKLQNVITSHLETFKSELLQRSVEFESNNMDLERLVKNRIGKFHF
jgi:hypothetical protein